MKILLDPQIFLTQKFGGISRLFVELWKYSLQRRDISFECPLIYSENLHLADSGLAPGNIFKILHDVQFRGVGRIKDKLKSVATRRTIKRLKKGDFDIFVPTYYDPYFLEYIGSKPFVLTVYDMIHEMLPQYFIADKKTVFHKKELLGKASVAVAISEHTKNDILNIYPELDAGKIKVIHLAQSMRDEDEIPIVPLPENYILFVGNRANYKNFNFFTETIASLLKNDHSLFLVCAGGGKFTKQENDFLQTLGIHEKVIQKNYTDNELPAFYRSAKVFVFPSEYEGFGIPTLEAMKCGCPVLLANSSCLPEIGGDAAAYFRLNDPSSLLKALTDIINNEKLRSEMIEKGFQRENEFSWSKTADAYFDTFKQLLN